MKLRLKGNSIRFRLTRGEVAALASGGVVRERTGFAADSALAYSVRADASAADVKATFSGGEITLLVPLRAARQWAQTEQVGINAEQRIEGEQTVQIAIEKDFACRTPSQPGEDADAFPNPAACDE